MTARLIELIDLARAHPLVLMGLAVAAIAGIALLQRQPTIQRDADTRLAALRRDKADQYTSLRPPH